MKIPLSLCEYYQKLPRAPTRNYSVYVTHPLDDLYLEQLVEKIKKTAQQEGYTEHQTVEFAAAFIQSLPYTVDSVTTPYDEYPRYPIEMGRVYNSRHKSCNKNVKFFGGS